MYLIGLTGGIASGKSTVARRLVEHGAEHIDADQVARRAVEPGTEALAAIREKFGDSVIAVNGTLDREKLGRIVFADDEAREALNKIVHPAVAHLTDSLIAEIARDRPDAVIVYDVPLLVEARVDRNFDLIVVAQAPKRTRVDRLVDIRGFERAHAQQRVDSQATDTERIAIADVVIDTGGSLASTMSQADSLWLRIRDEIAERAN